MSSTISSDRDSCCWGDADRFSSSGKVQLPGLGDTERVLEWLLPRRTAVGENALPFESSEANIISVRQRRATKEGFRGLSTTKAKPRRMGLFCLAQHQPVLRSCSSARLSMALAKRQDSEDSLGENWFDTACCSTSEDLCQGTKTRLALGIPRLKMPHHHVLKEKRGHKHTNKRTHKMIGRNKSRKYISFHALAQRVSRHEDAHGLNIRTSSPSLLEG